jgi:23S rRNA (cytidine1920-2'-O)/16S rRNA (cytidine1409-2'-O)-methyltransferase
MSEGRLRIDQLLVERGLAESRERAQALVIAGYVLVDGQKARKPGQAARRDSRIELIERLPFVGRGGLKLQGALDGFGIDVAGKVCVDIGSSTGGFTDCLLQRGAARVYAIDVGKGQLDWKLRTDPRVVVREGVNAREGFDLPERVDLVVADVSFISLRIALLPSFRHLREGGDVVALVKPQFEAGHAAVARGGNVRGAKDRAAAVVAVCEAFTAVGVGALAIVPSRLPGREGNREIFVHCRNGDPGLTPGRIRERAAEAAE